MTGLRHLGLSVAGDWGGRAAGGNGAPGGQTLYCARHRASLMNPRKRRRLAFAVALLVAGAGGAALVVAALKDNVLYFYSPSDVADEACRSRASISASAGWWKRAAS